MISCSCNRRACSPLFAQKAATKVAGYTRSRLAPLCVLAINRRGGWIGCSATEEGRYYTFAQRERESVGAAVAHVRGLAEIAIRQRQVQGADAHKSRAVFGAGSPHFADEF